MLLSLETQMQSKQAEIFFFFFFASDVFTDNAAVFSAIAISGII